LTDGDFSVWNWKSRGVRRAFSVAEAGLVNSERTAIASIAHLQRPRSVPASVLLLRSVKFRLLAPAGVLAIALMRGSGDGVHGEDVSFSTATLRGLERGFCVTLQLDEA
jgi:hypothetical protein